MRRAGTAPAVAMHESTDAPSNETTTATSRAGQTSPTTSITSSDARSSNVIATCTNILADYAAGLESETGVRNALAATVRDLGEAAKGRQLSADELDFLRQLARLPGARVLGTN